MMARDRRRRDRGDRFGNAEGDGTIYGPYTGTLKDRLTNEEQGFYDIASEWDYTPRELTSFLTQQMGPIQPEIRDQIAAFQDWGVREGEYGVFSQDEEERKLLYEQWLMKDSAQIYRGEWVQTVGPETIAMSLPMPQIVQKAASWVYQQIFMVYGSEQTAAILQGALIDDPDMRDKFWETMNLIANANKNGLKADGTYSLGGSSQSGGFDPNAQAGGPAFYTPEAAQLRYTDPQKILEILLNNPQEFKNLNLKDQRTAIDVAQFAIADKGKFETGKYTDDFFQAQQVWSEQNGWKIALDDTEVQRLDEFLKQVGVAGPKTLEFGRTPEEIQADRESLPGKSFWTEFIATPEMENMGITNFRWQEGGVPTIEFDQEWARENFVEHQSVLRYIEEKLHDEAGITYQVSYGEGGLLFNIGEFFGKNSDYIAGALGAQVEAWSDFFTETPDSRERSAEMRDELKAALAAGQVDDKDVDAVVSRILDLDEQATMAGATWEEMNRRMHPQQPGTAFGESVTRSAGVFPGDAGYNDLFTGASAFGSIVFDPFIIGGKFGKAFKLAQVLPAETAISNSRFTQFMFDAMAKPAASLMYTKKADKVLDRMLDFAGAADSAEDMVARWISVGMAGDDATLLRLAKAARTGDRETLRGVYIHAMTGDGWAETLKEMSDYKVLRLQEQLDKLADLPQQIKNVKAQINRRAAKVAKPFQRPAAATFDPAETVAKVGKKGVDEEGFLIHVTPAYDEVYETGRLEPRRYGGVPVEDELMDEFAGVAGLPKAGPQPARVFFAEDVDTALEMSDIGGRTGRVVIRVPKAEVEKLGELLPDPTTIMPKWQDKASWFLPDQEVDLRAMGAQILDEKGKWVPMFEDTTGVMDEMAELAKKLTALDDEYRALKPLKDDLLAQKYYHEDILRGPITEPTLPIPGLPEAGTLRGLGVSQTRYGRIWDFATDIHRELPHKVWQTMDGPTLRRFMANHPRLEEKTGRLAALLQRWGTDTHFGERIFINDHAMPAGYLPDETVRRNYDTFIDVGKQLGVPQEMIEKEVAQLVAVRAAPAPEKYRAWVQAWENLVENSRRLPDIGKQELTRIWRNSHSADNIYGTRDVIGKGGRTFTPTISVPNEAGSVIAKPSASAEMLSSIPLPSREAMQDYIYMGRRMARGWTESGKLGRTYMAKTYLGLAGAWRKFNSAWATWTLGGKLLGSLPMRIQMEQALRIEAFGYNSIAGHPVSWFKSMFRKGEMMGDDVVELGMDTYIGSMGTMVDNLIESPTWRTRTRGSAMFKLSDPRDVDLAIQGIAAKLKTWAASPEYRIILNKAKYKSPAKMLKAMQENPHIWKLWGPYMDEIIEENVRLGGKLDSYQAIVKSMSDMVEQIVGTGPGAEIVRNVARTGTIGAGKNRQVVLDVANAAGRRSLDKGGQELLNQLRRLYKDGDWVPGIDNVPANWVRDIATRGDVLADMRAFRDYMFRNLYSRPDAYMGRLPLARQIAAREYDRLISLGFSKKKALDAARIQGARETAEILFTIGAHSSADMWLRSVMPFFPAWKELSLTWLKKIPMDLGGGGGVGWLLGAPGLVSRVQSLVDYAVESGLVYRDGDAYKVRMGFMAPVFRALGLEVDSVAASVETFTGVLPAPDFTEDKPWIGLLPKVGAPTGQLLHFLGDEGLNPWFSDLFSDLEEKFTLFGGDVSLAPATFDNLYTAITGQAPPWLWGTSRLMADYSRNSSVVDALRANYAKNPPPNEEDFKTRQAYTKAYAEWLDDWIESGRNDSKVWYMFRAIGGMTLPFSVRYTHDADEELRALNDVINNADPDLRTPFLDAFREEYPDLQGYLTGKTLPLVPDEERPEYEGYESFKEELEFGMRKQLTPEEWAIYSQGFQNAVLYWSAKDQAYQELGDTPQEWLMNTGKADKDLVRIEREWQQYLDQTVEIGRILDLRDASGNPTNFKILWDQLRDERFARIYGGERIDRKSIKQETMANALDNLDTLIGQFSKYGIVSDDYFAIRGKVSEGLKEFEYVAETPQAKAVSWWWENYGREYADGKRKIYDKINSTEEQLRDGLYQELAAYENEWTNKTISHPKWGVMPTPQEVFWQRLSPNAQNTKKLEWAKLPPQFLSQWARENTYGESPKAEKLNQLAVLINGYKGDLDEWAGRNLVSTSSNDYEAMKKRTEQAVAEWARENDVYQEYLDWQKPAYQRVDETGLMRNNPYWSQIVTLVDQGRRQLEASEISVGSRTNPVAVQWQLIVNQTVDTLRKQDKDLDFFFELLNIAYSDDGIERPLVGNNVYWPLFYDGWGSAPDAWVYYGTKEK